MYRKLHLKAGAGVKLPPSDLWRQDLKAPMLYRIASILLLLFDVGHTLGFRQSDPKWGVDALLASMRSIHFDVQGFSRTYWDLFVGAGLFVSVFLLFAAVLTWQLAGLPALCGGLKRSCPSHKFLWAPYVRPCLWHGSGTCHSPIFLYSVTRIGQDVGLPYTRYYLFLKLL